MKITIDVRNIHDKKQKAHAAFVDFVYHKAVYNRNTEVYLRDKVGSICVAKNGQLGKRG